MDWRFPTVATRLLPFPPPPIPSLSVYPSVYMSLYFNSQISKLPFLRVSTRPYLYIQNRIEQNRIETRCLLFPSRFARPFGLYIPQ